MAIDPNATTVNPTGLGHTLLIVTIFFTIPTAIIVFLRCWVRIKHRTFGVDDGLMLFGWMLYMGVSGIVAHSTYHGLGMKDAYLNATIQSNGRRYLWYFQTTYCCSLLFIKGAICATLLRIAVARIHRLLVWITLIFSILSTTSVIIGLLVICRPISAAWDGQGTCAPTVVIASLGYLVSAGAVFTDWSCAILPVFMLYKTKMKRAVKISISIILSLGVLASICTIIRLPYVKYYTMPDDYLYNVANIILWSIVESGIGIIAGSLPALKKLVKSRHVDLTDEHSPAQITPNAKPGRVTITSRAMTETDGRKSSTAARADWVTLCDDSPNQGNFPNVDVEMQALERPTTYRRSHASTDELVGSS